MQRYPIYFSPVYKDYTWGGEKISTHLGRSVPFSRVAESWEIADHKDGMSIVENGVYQDASLSELIQEHGTDLMGRKGEKFPLLIKILDARSSLSIQVHPDEKSALRVGGEPKTEMWYVMEAEPNAGLLIGFREKATLSSFVKASEENRVVEIMERYRARRGDAFFIPGGTIHAILHGGLIFEVQQNSNTTYRIYDWERGRPLHLKEASEVLIWEKSASARCIPGKVHGGQTLHTSSHFAMEKWTQSLCLRGPFSSFQVFFLLEGHASIEVEGNKTRLASTRACLVPASAEEIAIELEQGGTYLRVFLPEVE